ncbi:MAG: hypothetical protein WCG25_07720 [bacterium]
MLPIKNEKVGNRNWERGNGKGEGGKRNWEINNEEKELGNGKEESENNIYYVK